LALRLGTRHGPYQNFKEPAEEESWVGPNWTCATARRSIVAPGKIAHAAKVALAYFRRGWQNSDVSLFNRGHLT
jgi:hypothetical protein